MKTLREYLERNQYNIVNSIKEVLGIDDTIAKRFYQSLSPEQERNLIDSLSEPVTDEKKSYVETLYKDFSTIDEASDNETGFKITDADEGGYNVVDKATGEVVDHAHSGHEAHNLLHYHRATAAHKARTDAPVVDEAVDGEYSRIASYSKAPSGLATKPTQAHIWKSKHDEVHHAGQHADRIGQPFNNFQNAEDADTHFTRRGYKKVDEAKKPDVSRLASKAGNPDNPAKSLSLGQYQNKIVPNKAKQTDRAGDKSKLKRGVWENSFVPVIVSENETYRLKMVESKNIDSTVGIMAMFEAATVTSMPSIKPMSVVPGFDIDALKKLSGIKLVDPECDSEVEINTGEEDFEQETGLDFMGDQPAGLEEIIASISNLDDATKEALFAILSKDGQISPQTITAEEMLKIKEGIASFGSALQDWVEQSGGVLDFLYPLIEVLWVKYNEFMV